MEFKLTLTESQSDSLKEFIRYYFIQSIRDDEDCDSLLYIYNIVNLYDALGGLKEDYGDYEPCNK